MDRRKGMVFPLGAAVMEDGVNFSIAVDGGKKCDLLLYRKGEAEPFEVMRLEEMPEQGNIRSVFVADRGLNGCEYNYCVDGKVVTDPFARAVSGKEKWGKSNMVRGMIWNEEYDWEGDVPLHIGCHEVVAYSIHVRGFTKHSSSKVKHKGTFRGVQEKIPYLVELGINQIQCMPVYEFEETGRYTNYWGYGPAYCFAPKASYSANGNPQRELKDMVKACHKEGIEVVLEMPFTDGMPHRMISDCIRYYKMEYHVDGFIVNPFRAPFKELRRDPFLARTKILKKQDDFQNVMRRFLKGDEGMVEGVMWWQRHISEEEGIFNYITSHTGFTLHDLVSYDRKHNEANGEKNQDGPDYNYSWNCGAEGPSRKKAVTELRKNQIRNAFLLLLMAQGTPCILAGDEFHNSQKGNNNVYCQDNETGWLNWSKLSKEPWLFQYVKELIAFRKEHPVLHCEHELMGIDKMASGVPDISYHGESAWQVPSEVSSRQLGVYYYGETMGDVSCFAAYNMHWLKHSFALPALRKGKKWYLAVSTKDGVLKEEKLLKNQREAFLDERTIAIFVGR